jgi:hypothetical protein
VGELAIGEVAGGCGGRVAVAVVVDAAAVTGVVAALGTGALGVIGAGAAAAGGGDASACAGGDVGRGIGFSGAGSRCSTATRFWV